MSQTVRAFIAAKAPCTSDLKPVLRDLGAMGRALKAVSADHLHVTLKFLGDVSLERTVGVGRALAEAARGVSAIDAKLRGVGAFPHAGRPSVIWAGLVGAEPLLELSGRLEALLEQQGFAREARAFHPHVTLARVKSRPPDELQALLKRHADSPFGAAPLRSIELYQSELRPQGPRYTVLARVEFQGER